MKTFFAIFYKCLSLFIRISELLIINVGTKKRPKLIILALLIFFSHSSYLDAQTLGWANAYKAHKDVVGQYLSYSDMKADKDGNILVSGQPLGQDSACLAKFDSSGHLLWAIYPKIAQYASIDHIEISENGDYFFSGSSDNLKTQPFPVVKPPSENSNCYIAKCTPSGLVLWVRKYIGYSYPQNTYTLRILNFKVDKNENVYFEGRMPYSPDFLQIDTTKYSSPRGGNFIASFDSNGSFRWINTGLFDTYSIQALGMDPAGNTYCFAQNIDPYAVTVVNKFSANGILVGKLDFDSIGKKVVLDDIALDSSGNIYISGHPSYLFTTGFVYKFDSNLHIVWHFYLPSGVGGVGGLHVAVSNYIRQTKYLYLTGQYKKPFTLGAYSTINGVNDTIGNQFVAKINEAGQTVNLMNTTNNTGKRPQGIFSSILIMEDACSNFYIAYSFDYLFHFLGINITYSHFSDPGGVIAKFSSDSIAFQRQNTCSGLYLKNISQSAFKEFQWYAAKLPGDSSLGKLIANTRDLHNQFPHKGQYVITLVGIKGGGCTNVARDTFNVPGSPVSGFLAGDSQGCQYVNFAFSDTSHADTINKVVGESWYWDFGDQSPALSYTQKRPMVNHVYTKDGTYTVKLVYGNGFGY